MRHKRSGFGDQCYLTGQGDATGDEREMKWLDKIPYTVLVPLAVFLALAPFSPEPHLW